jgi:hypothetical protein
MKRFLVAGLLSCGLAHLAFGDGLELEITDGTNSALISSGTLVLTGSASATASPNLALGVFTLDADVGNYIVNVTIGEGSPLEPIGSLDLNAMDTSGPVSGPLEIWWSENGIPTVLSGWTMTWGGTFSSGTGANVSATAYEDNTNSFFGTGVTIGTIGPQGPGVVGGTVVASVPGVTSGYSLSELITLNGVGATNYSGDASLTGTTVPEPTNLFLVCGVFFAVGTTLRRKLMNKA